MALFTLERNDLCLCGSGKKYKHCCLRYIELTLDDFYVEVDKSNYELAYNAINAILTKYLIAMKRHTIPMLKQNKTKILPLLKIDIEAVGEILEKILFLSNKEGIIIDFFSKINFILSILEDKFWNERMKSFILIYYYYINYDEKILNSEVETIKIDEIEDVELIKLVLDIKKNDLGIGQELALIETIIVSEKDEFIKAKYQFQKALIFFLNNDKETALKIAKVVIEILNNSSIKKTYDFYISAQMFSLFAQMTTDKVYFNKAIDLYLKMKDDNNFTDLGKAKNLVDLGHTYYLIGDYKNAIKYLVESKNHKYLYLADICMAFIKVDINDYKSAEKILSQIVYKELEEEKFDYLLAYSLYILKSKDKSKIDIISNYLKNICFDNMRYFDTKKMTLLMELQDLSFSDSIEDVKIRKKWLDKLNNVFILQPNFFGIGININKLINEFNKK